MYYQNLIVPSGTPPAVQHALAELDAEELENNAQYAKRNLPDDRVTFLKGFSRNEENWQTRIFRHAAENY